MKCSLCEAAGAALFFRKTDPHLGERDYFECATCRLVFVPAAQHLDARGERAVYTEHENDPDDPRYLDYLRSLADPVRAHVPAPAQGLDYGCGPGPGMGSAMGEGYAVTNYDPLYFPDTAALEKHYDFITCCEAAEHFSNPRKEFGRLGAALAPGGVLGIRTEVPPEDFGSWWYHGDPTHVSFYSIATMEWVARWQGWRLKQAAGNVFLFLGE